MCPRQGTLLRKPVVLRLTEAEHPGPDFIKGCHNLILADFIAPVPDGENAKKFLFYMGMSDSREHLKGQVDGNICREVNGNAASVGNLCDTVAVGGMEEQKTVLSHRNLFSIKEMVIASVQLIG